MAFDLNFRHAAEIFSGASDYLTEAHLDWQLMPLNFGFEARLMELARSGELAGALGTFVSDRWVQGLLETGVSAINMFNFSKIESIPTVGPDDFATGVAAAQHLESQGAQHFAFLGADGVYYTRLRQAGFQSGLGEKTYAELRPGPNLSEQLATLPINDSPLGIFCSNDLTARELILLTKRKGLRCGKDILIVGVDNDPSESIFAGIGISSFKQPIRETGYLAARALHEQMSSGQALSPLNLRSTSQLIPRESSLASNRARTGQQAANIIQERLATPDLDVEALARIVGVSRRSLELATQEQFNSSPYQMIAQARLKLAKHLLQSSPLPIMEIGARCGYPEPHHFSAWFKKQSGLAPKIFREKVENS